MTFYSLCFYREVEILQILIIPDFLAYKKCLTHLHLHRFFVESFSSAGMHKACILSINVIGEKTEWGIILDPKGELIAD